MQYFGFDRPSFGIKTFSFGSSEFSPLDLFADGKQGVWYDPADKSTLFQDVAGTIPVTKDGDPVALMRDKSGNGNHATQTVSTARPVYKTDGVLHWLAFDGTDDRLSTANTDFMKGSEASYIMGVLMQNSGDVFNYRSVTDNGYSDFTLRITKTTHDVFAVNPNSTTSVAVGATDSIIIATAVAALGAIKSRRNSAPVAEKSGTRLDFDTGRNLGQKVILGGNGGASFSKSNLYGLALINKEVTTLDLIKIEQYIAKNSGVTL